MMNEKTHSEDVKTEIKNLGITLSKTDFEERDLELVKISRRFFEMHDWQKSLGTAQMILGNYERSEALRKVAHYLASNGHLERAFFVFAEAEREAMSDSLTQWQRAELLLAIALSLYQTRAIFRADEIMERAVLIAQRGELSSDTQDSLDASSVLGEIALEIAKRGNTALALKTAETIQNMGKRDRILHKLSAEFGGAEIAA